MAFTQQSINYAQQYSKELANAYPYLSYFNDIYMGPNSTTYKPINAATVLIPSMTVKGATAVNRDTISGTINRNFNMVYEPKTMSMYRQFSTIIDPMDEVQTNEVATIANVTKTFNELQKIPEQDAYAASKLASFASSFGGVDSTTLSASNILAQWDAYLQYMVDQRVNRDRVKVYMVPAVYKLLKEATGLTRFIETTNGIRDVDRNIAKLDGVAVAEVPTDMMQTAYDFTEGFTPAAGASTINMLLVDPLATCAPIVYDVSMITPASAITQGKDVYFESYYYDVFKLNQRQAGFFANLSAPALGTVTVTSVAGTAATGDTKITYASAQLDTNGNPFYGLDAYISVGNTTAPAVAYGEVLPTGATWVKITGTNPYTASSQTAGKYATVALVNKQTGMAIAAGSAVEVVK